MTTGINNISKPLITANQLSGELIKSFVEAFDFDRKKSDDIESLKTETFRINTYIDIQKTLPSIQQHFKKSSGPNRKKTTAWIQRAMCRINLASLIRYLELDNINNAGKFSLHYVSSQTEFRCYIVQNALVDLKTRLLGAQIMDQIENSSKARFKRDGGLAKLMPKVLPLDGNYFGFAPNEDHDYIIGLIKKRHEAILVLKNPGTLDEIVTSSGLVNTWRNALATSMYDMPDNEIPSGLPPLMMMTHDNTDSHDDQHNDGDNENKQEISKNQQAARSTKKEDNNMEERGQDGIDDGDVSMTNGDVDNQLGNDEDDVYQLVTDDEDDMTSLDGVDNLHIGTDDTKATTTHQPVNDDDNLTATSSKGVSPTDATGTSENAYGELKYQAQSTSSPTGKKRKNRKLQWNQRMDGQQPTKIEWSDDDEKQQEESDDDTSFDTTTSRSKRKRRDLPVTISNARETELPPQQETRTELPPQQETQTQLPPRQETQTQLPPRQETTLSGDQRRAMQQASSSQSTLSSTNSGALSERQGSQIQKRASKSSKRYTRWTEDEVAALREGLGRHRDRNWSKILAEFSPRFAKGRTNVDLRDKARNEIKRRRMLNLPLDEFFYAM